jgi:hypothetical protein
VIIWGEKGSFPAKTRLLEKHLAQAGLAKNVSWPGDV